MKHPQTWLQYVNYRYMNALYKANKPTTLQIKISAVSVFLEANHHSIITHIITLDKKTLK